MEISDEEIRSLSVAIQKRYGVDFTCYEIKSLKRRIIRIINLFKLNSIFELWEKILKDPSFVEEFTNSISVGLTSMFRDPQLWIYLKKYIRNFFESDKKNRMQVWHAGCSTGEEVYSLGILFNELDVQYKVHALATDINTDSLAHSKKGLYGKGFLEDYSKNYNQYNAISNFNKYYTLDNEGFQMNKDLIRHVEFKEHNLITSKYEGKYDIIFCRNVMIYFDNNAKSEILKKFHDILNDDGILIIGFFDSFMPFVKDKLFEYSDTDVRVLKKVPIR